MTVEISWPVELVVAGTPLSLAASARGIENWKQRIRSAARLRLPEGHFLSEAPVRVTIFYFADTPVRFDIDNIVKPILDALNRLVIVDDRQVERLVVQKFEPGRLFTFASPSAMLSDAIEGSGPRVYLEIRGSEPGEIAS